MNHQLDRRTVKGLLVPLHAPPNDSVTRFALMKQKGDDLLVDESFLRVGETGLLHELEKHQYHVVEIVGVMRKNERGEPMIDVVQVSLPRQSSSTHDYGKRRRPRLLRSRRFIRRRRLAVLGLRSVTDGWWPVSGPASRDGVELRKEGFRNRQIRSLGTESAITVPVFEGIA